MKGSEERASVPGVGGAHFPAPPGNGTNLGDSVVENHGVEAHFPLRGQLREPLARHPLDLAFLAIQHRTVLDKLHAKRRLQLTHAPDQRVDGAARHSCGALVDADQNELIVPDVAAGGQRHAVGGPLIDERIGFGEDTPALLAGQRTRSRKNPEAGVWRQLLERDSGHDPMLLR
jgi:hypothetical protein